MSNALVAGAGFALPPTDPLQLLDDPQEWSAFSRAVAQAGDCWESNVVIEGMHCAACAITIEDALLKVPGVERAEVSAASRRAKVVWHAKAVAPSAWMQAVSAVGYRALPANDAFVNERRTAERRAAVWRMSVAGFCMMQVMMYAWPAYVARPGDLSAEMEQLLRWASWVLTLPVILFSCGPFFRSAWRDLRQRSISMDLPVVIGMGMTFVVSTLGTFNPGGTFGREVYFDSLTMFVFFLLTGRWLELRLRDRTAGALEALMNRLPDSVLRQKTSAAGAPEFERVALRRLAVGDVLRVLPGEAFPVDGVVLQGQSLVDEALLTGESTPLERGVGAPVIAGSHNLGAPLLVQVQQLGANTRFAQIVALMESAAVEKPQLAQLADRVAKPFLQAVLLAAALAAAWGWQHNPAHAVMVAVAVLVVTCPCALSLATPAAMLSAAGALARQGVLVRRLQALEALSQVNTVVFDKTGTLTQERLGLTATQVRAGWSEAAALALAASLAEQSLHPVSRALVAAAQLRSTAQAPVAVAALTDVHEVLGQGVQARSSALGSLRLGSAAFCGLPEMAMGTRVFLTDDAGWLATFELQEQLRAGAKACVAALQAAGVQVQLLSGDTPAAAQRVAASVGIAQVRGACSPQDKLDFLRQAQAQGQRVAVVGDGLNDGPMLAGAHVSFAVGSAVPLAQARADLVLLGQNLGGVAQALLLARRTLRVVRQNLVWAAAYNALCVPLAVAGWLPPWLAGLGMALSSLLVVLNALKLSRNLALLQET